MRENKKLCKEEDKRERKGLSENQNQKAGETTNSHLVPSQISMLLPLQPLLHPPLSLLVIVIFPPREKKKPSLVLILPFFFEEKEFPSPFFLFSLNSFFRGKKKIHKFRNIQKPSLTQTSSQENTLFYPFSKGDVSSLLSPASLLTPFPLFSFSLFSKFSTLFFISIFSFAVCFAVVATD